MKLVLVLIIMSVSFFIGQVYKKKLKSEYDFLIYLKNFSEFLKSNINLFKNNLVEIIDSYILLDENKNAKFMQIFQKKGEIYEISQENIEKLISDKQISFVIYSFLVSLGSNEYIFETEKISTFINFLDGKVLEYANNLKTKTDLFLKVALYVGAVISILVWWVRWTFRYYLKLVQLAY